jgi:hypothetical protein
MVWRLTDLLGRPMANIRENASHQFTIYPEGRAFETMAAIQRGPHASSTPRSLRSKGTPGARHSRMRGDIPFALELTIKQGVNKESLMVLSGCRCDPVFRPVGLALADLIMALLEILGRGFQRAAKIPARKMRTTPRRRGVGGPLQAQSCAEGALPKICVPFCVSGLVSRYAAARSSGRKTGPLMRAHCFRLQRPSRTRSLASFSKTWDWHGPATSATH